MHIEQVYKIVLKRRQSRMAQTVKVKEKIIERYWYTEKRELMRVSDGRWKMQKAERSGQYLVLDCITIKRNRMECASGANVHRGSTTRFALKLVYLSKDSSMAIFIEVVRNVDAESSENVSDTKVGLMLVKSGWVMVVQSPRRKDADLEEWFFRKIIKYGIILQRVFSSDSFRLSGKRWNMSCWYQEGRGRQLDKGWEGTAIVYHTYYV